MTDYIQQYQNPRFPLDREEVERLENNLRNEASYQDGVVRWKSSNRAVPQDCAEFAEFIGLPVDIEKTRQARLEDIDELLAEYQQAQPAEPTPEEQHEMRAAFGPGVKVINVLTGRRHTT